MRVHGVALALALLLPLAAVAQQRPAPASPQTEKPAAPTPVVPVEPTGFDYNPENRRDPFVSLVRRGSTAARSAPGGRGAGLAGLATSEVTLKGTLQTGGGWIGMLEGVDQKTYIVRPGDRLADGVIRAITATAVVILQQVTDPLSLEKQREVRKTIRQTDEAK